MLAAMKIAFIGLGRMGMGMARNLLRAGHTVAVYNRSREKAVALAADGARVASSPADACRDAEVVHDHGRGRSRGRRNRFRK